MNERREKSQVAHDTAPDWEIQFRWKSNKLRSGLFDVALCFSMAIFLLILIIVKRMLLADILFLAAIIVFFIWVGWAKFPFKPAQIEKSGDELLLTIWFASMGISEFYSRITLSKQQSWSFSEETRILKFRPASAQAFLLNGIAQKDLDFLLDWLGRNFKRSHTMGHD